MDTNFKILKQVRDGGLISKGDRLVVGLSGGIDSVVLLDVLSRLKEELGLYIAVAHVNYGLRGKESERDERFVKGMAKRYGIHCVIARPKAKIISENLQNTARNFRYGFFLKIAQKVKAEKMAVAHNSDDQAETMLLHLIRGSGLKGLGGMEPARELAKGFSVVRPLLSTTREDIVRYVKERKLKFVEDRTNKTKKYSRNIVRHNILPLLKKHNPNIIGHLCKTAAILRDEDAALDEICHSRGGLSSPRSLSPHVASRERGSLVRNCVRDIFPPIQRGGRGANYRTTVRLWRRNDSKITFNRAGFLEHHVAIQRRILRFAYARLTGGTADLVTDHIDKMIWIISSPAQKGEYSLPRGVKFARKGNTVILFR